MPFEHSRKHQNVGYTTATIGCSLKQPKTVSVRVKAGTSESVQNHILEEYICEAMLVQSKIKSQNYQKPGKLTTVPVDNCFLCTQ